ncbi:MAG: hypothetical protein ABIG87_01775 [Patescibacteria group bacterium]
MAFIQNIQNKTDKQKKVILFASVGIIMAFVFIVWILQIKNNSARRLKLETETQSQLPPLSEIKNGVVDVYNESAEKIKNIKEALGAADI